VQVSDLLENYVRKLSEFERFDVDHDGNLTEVELEAGLRAQHKSDREIKQMWERLELNDRGGVGPREYALMSIAT
jgi:Ca2+-binding EF-hand superfamily protein